MPADLIFDNLRLGVADGSISWTGDTISSLVVLADLWTPDESDAVVDDILTAGAVEAAGTGDRQDLTTRAVNLDSGLHRAFWAADAIAYPNIPDGTSYDSLVVFKFVTDDTDSLLLGLFSLQSQVGDGADADLTPDANGYFEF